MNSTKNSFIICESETALRKCVSFMDSFDKSLINAYVNENIKMIRNLPREYFIRLVVKYIDYEIDSNNSVYVNTFHRLMKIETEEKKAKQKMAQAIEEEFKKDIFYDKRPDDENAK